MEQYWLTDEVAIPQRLLGELKQGKVVFFVGAGVSSSNPSNMPNFQELVNQIVSKSACEIQENEAFDRYLGRLERVQPPFNLRKHVKGILQTESVEPNDLHKIIIKLANCYDEPRVITTNYENLLEKAADELELSFSESWCAPALPPGNRFNGIVHLHGSLEAETEIVLTDRDLGEAYLYNGWATKFIRELFSNYTVVFVGYSLGDPTVYYLVSSAPLETQCYLFSKEENVGLNSFGENVKLISIGHQYENLPIALNEWYFKEKATNEEKTQRINSYFDKQGSLSKSEESWMASLLNSEEDTEILITEMLKRDEKCLKSWIIWLAQNESLGELFKDSESTKVNSVLVKFFVENLALNPNRLTWALNIFAFYGCEMSKDMQKYFSTVDSTFSSSFKRLGEIWDKIFVFSGVNTPFSKRYSNYITGRVAYGEINRTLLGSLLSPRLTFTRIEELSDSTLGTQQKAEALFLFSDVYMDGLKTKIYELAAEDYRSIILIVEKALHDLYAIYSLLDEGNQDKHDSLSYRRSAVKNHEQDSHGEEYFVLVDLLRDLALADKQRHRYWIDSWIVFENETLFRRLALFLLAETEELTESEKIDWLVKHVQLDEVELRYEIFECIKTLAPKIEDNDLERILSTIKEDNKTHDSHFLFDVLEWMTRHGATSRLLARKYRQMNESGPDRLPKEEPGLMYSTSFAVLGEDPMKHAKIEEILQSPDDKTLLQLKDLLNVSFFERRDYIATLEQTKVDPRVNLSLLKQALESPENEQELVEVLVQTSSAHGLSKDEFWELIEIIKRCKESHSQRYKLVEHFTSFLTEERITLADLIDIERIAEECLSILTTNLHDNDLESSRDAVQAMHLGMNSTQGKIVEILQRILSKRSRVFKDERSLPNLEENKMFENLFDMENPYFYSNLSMLGKVVTDLPRQHDEAIEKKLKEVAKAEKANECWVCGWMYNNAYNEAVVRKLVLPSFRCLIERESPFEDNGLNKLFYNWFCIFLVKGVLERADVERIITRYATRETPKQIERLYETVKRFLKESRSFEQQVLEKFLRYVVESRINGVPREASESELSSLANIGFSLENCQEDFIEAFSDVRPPLFITSKCPPFIEVNWSPSEGMKAFIRERLAHTTINVKDYKHRFFLQRLIESEVINKEYVQENYDSFKD